MTNSQPLAPLFFGDSNHHHLPLSTGKQCYRIMPKAATKAGHKSTKTPVPSATISELRQVGAKGKEDNSLSEATCKAYKGQIERARTWLAGIIKTRDVMRKAGTSPEDDFDDEVLAKAFDSQKPNKLSADALELFMTQKCLAEGHTASADAISSAFIDLWKYMYVTVIFALERLIC